MAFYRGIGGSGDATDDASITQVTEAQLAAAASASAAATSASNASTSASAASTSASNASTSASAAASSASSASSSSISAASYASLAAISETNAAASYDSFDDRYLGAKASDPSVDNDGDALLTGALYFDSTSSALKVYNGTTWSAISGGGGGGGLTAVVDDTTPQLGGTLDANGNTIDMGVNVITDAKVGQWDTAYGWGNHASAGYLTSFTETNNLSVAVTWANVPDVNITQSSVTQHQAALSITESQISDLQTYLSASSTVDGGTY